MQVLLFASVGSILSTGKTDNQQISEKYIKTDTCIKIDDF